MKTVKLLGIAVLLGGVAGPLAAQSEENWTKPVISGLSESQSHSDGSPQIRGDAVENVIDWPVQVWPIGTNPSEIPNVDYYRQVVEGLNDPKFFQVRYGWTDRVAWDKQDGSISEGTDRSKKAEVIGVFQRKAVPIRLSVLIEASRTTKFAWPFLSRALQEILSREMRPEDAYTIASYDDAGSYQPYYGTVSNIAQLFRSFPVKSAPTAPRFTEAVSAALNRMDAQAGDGNVKKILLVICDGSRSDDLSASNGKKYSLEDQVIRSNTQIVIIRTTSREILRRPWEGGVLAGISGGLVFNIDPDRELNIRRIDYDMHKQAILNNLKEIYSSLQIDRRVRIILRDLRPGSITPIYMRVNMQLPETRHLRYQGRFQNLRLFYPQFYVAPESQSEAS